MSERPLLHVLCADADDTAVIERVRAAIDGGAAVNAVDAAGESAVHAMMRSATSVARARALLMVLRDAGAELSVISFSGKTPLEVCARPELAEVLAQLGGKTARQAVKPTPTHRNR